MSSPILLVWNTYVDDSGVKGRESVVGLAVKIENKNTGI